VERRIATFSGAFSPPVKTIHAARDLASFLVERSWVRSTPTSKVQINAITAAKTNRRRNDIDNFGVRTDGRHPAAEMMCVC
jgi:hypothetical protein